MNTLARTSNPAEIARMAIRRLAESRIAPTPENFTRAYRDAAGGGAGDVAGGVEPEQVLSELVERIVARRPDLGSALRLQEHVTLRAWNDALKVVDETVAKALVEPSREWPQLAQKLLTQLDTTHANWTRARKLGAVRHILQTPSVDDRTREKLESLMIAWASNAEDHGDPPAPRAPAAAGSDGPRPGVGAAAVDASTGAAPLTIANRAAEADAWRLLALAALDLNQPAERRRSTATPGNGPDTLGVRLERFAGAPGAEWLDEIQAAAAAKLAEAGRQAALRDRLVKLLRLVCENLGLFADDDAWVHGQVTRIAQLLDAPLDERALTEAEDSLRRAVRRQSELKTDLNVATAAVKAMLASLIDRLAAAAASTSEFHHRIGERAEAIRQADDLPSLSRVVASLLDDTIEMRDGMQRTHGELSAARDSAQQYEARVQALEQELVDVSSLVRLDPLTQVLNRRGLEEVFAIEQARAERERATLAVALLDIDNFKSLNDALGHQAGDLALKHLSGMVRSALRPTDTVARYGGEEFVILLPATSAAEAVDVLTRAQRQLTRAIFLHNGEKVLITFSAGATDFRHGDNWESVMRRADVGLYAAKAAGKNRVHAA